MAVGTTVAKTTLAVGPETTFYQPANTVYTGVAANAWKLISELQSLPDIGDGERETVTYTSIDQGIVNKLKGIPIVHLSPCSCYSEAQTSGRVEAHQASSC